VILEAVARWDMDQLSMQLLNGRPPYPYSDDELRKMAPLRRARPTRLDSSEPFWQRFHVVSMIDTNTNTVAGTIPLGNAPYGVAITPDGTKIYVTNALDDTVPVINTATNLVIAHFTCGGRTPWVLQPQFKFPRNQCCSRTLLSRGHTRRRLGICHE
jgi:YVTN family beta-propeller protein